jgi:nucleotide-binding universal stress UspA family protein
MISIKHILFPMDFSERCLTAAPYVSEMAKRFSAKVTLLTAAQPAYYAGMIEAAPPVIIDPNILKEGLQARLDGVTLNKVQVDRIAELGDPATVIGEFARNRQVDLIMMPTHGYGPFRRLLLGSVTSKVLHDAECPVWTSAHVSDEEAEDHIPCRSVLCALDRTSDAARVMKWADEFAKAQRATLRLVHAIPAVEPWPDRQFDREYEVALKEEARNFLTALQEAAKVDAPLCIAAGDVAKMVEEEARRAHSDLVVIGRGAMQENLGRLRTHSYAIIRRAPCPVISV